MDICTGYDKNSIHQLEKKDNSNGAKYKIYPLTYVQAVYDARNGRRLDTLLDQCNSIYVYWKGSVEQTRLALPMFMRRKGIIITYRNAEDEVITEKSIYDDCIADDVWGLDAYWVRITDALPITGNVTIGSNGNWFINGEDTGFKAQGPKGENGLPLQPRLSEDKTKIEFTYDGNTWYELFPLTLVTPTIDISETVALEPGATPTVANVGDDFNVNLEFSLPKAPEVNVGSTTTIGEGNRAKVTNSGTKYAPVLNFEIPKGDTGRGINIKGFYPDLPTLQEKVTEPAIGDVYCVGSAEPYEGYVWTNVYSSGSQSSAPAWQSLGQINKDTTVIVNDLGDREDVAMSQKGTKDSIFNNNNLLFNLQSKGFILKNTELLKEKEYNILDVIISYKIKCRDDFKELKILQTGYSISESSTLFYLRDVNSEKIYNFKFDETDRNGIKKYKFISDIEIEIVFDWDKYNSYFDNRYAPDSVLSPDGNGLYINSFDPSLQDLKYCWVFDKLENPKDKEYDIIKCFYKYQIKAKGKFLFKLLQTGFSNIENKVIFYARNTENNSVVQFYTNEEERSGVKDYNLNSGEYILNVRIDWDKYNTLFDNRYAPDNTSSVNGNGIYIFSEDITEYYNNKELIDNVSNNQKLIIDNIQEHSVNAPLGDNVDEYYRNLYVTYNEPFVGNGILNNLYLTCFYPDDYDIETYNLTFYIGRIDQRGWLINPRMYSYMFSELSYKVEGNANNKNFTLYLKDKHIEFEEGEVLVLFSRRSSDGPDGFNCLIPRTNTQSDNVLAATSVDGVFSNNYAFYRFSFDYITFDLFSSKNSNVEEEISSLQEQINQIGIYTDKVSNEKYKIIVVNGEIKLKSLKYKKVLFIGSSFVTHGISEDIGWYRNGAMAPSIGEHSLPNLVYRSIKEVDSFATLDILASTDWERNINEYDLESNWGKTLTSVNPDVIFMHVTGNSTYNELFENGCDNMIKFVKGKCPNSDIYIAASWHGGEKATAMRNACLNNNVTYVDLSSYKVANNMWSAGDYYYSEDDLQYHDIYQVVTGHPNDVGCLMQANAFLRSCGYNEINNIHNITLVTSGDGKATIPNNKWLENGICTIRIVSGTVSSISVKTTNEESIEITTRTNDSNSSYNTYYTFTMPNYDVNINILFN